MAWRDRATISIMPTKANAPSTPAPISNQGIVVFVVFDCLGEVAEGEVVGGDSRGLPRY